MWPLNPFGVVSLVGGFFGSRISVESLPIARGIRHAFSRQTPLPAQHVTKFVGCIFFVFSLKFRYMFGNIALDVKPSLVSIVVIDHVFRAK